MRDVIITTDAMARFNAATDEILESGKAMSGFILAYGQAGRGKSVAADQYHIDRGGAYVRVWQGWSQTAFLQRLLFEVRGKNMDMPRHTGQRCKEMIVDIIDEQRRNGEMRPIFIDEADRLKIDRIEDLRDIHEMTGIPVVLIGEEDLLNMLSNRRRIWSRVVQEVEFGPLSPVEVGVYAMKAAGLDIPADECAKITTRAEGDFRLVRNMMLLLERSAKASGDFAVNADTLDMVLSSRTWRRG